MGELSVKVQNQLYPETPEQLALMREPGPEGPIVMVNLLKYRARAAYPDGRESALSGREAYGIYAREVPKLIMAQGGKLLFSGHVSALPLGLADPLWDDVALAQYPSRGALVAMTMMPAYQEIAVHRAAGLLGQLNIETVYSAGFLAFQKAMGG